MTNNLKRALTDVHAPETLIEDTKRKIDAQRKKPTHKTRLKGMAISVACAAMVMVFAFVGIYGVESAYISLDINPSIALSINGYGRVISAKAYGPASEEVLDSVSIQGEPYEQAVQTLLDAGAMQPYLDKTSSLWIAVQANDPDTEAQMESRVLSLATQTVESHHQDVAINASTVTEEVRSTSQSEGMTASKYLAICELQEVDPNAAVEAYRDSSIGEIHQQREACLEHAETGHNWHHGQATQTAQPDQVDSAPVPQASTASDVAPQEESAPSPQGNGAQNQERIQQQNGQSGSGSSNSSNSGGQSGSGNSNSSSSGHHSGSGSGHHGQGHHG